MCVCVCEEEEAFHVSQSPIYGHLKIIFDFWFGFFDFYWLIDFNSSISFVFKFRTENLTKMKQKKNESTENGIIFDSCRECKKETGQWHRNCGRSKFVDFLLFLWNLIICLRDVMDAFAETHLRTGLDKAIGVATPRALIRCCIVGVADVNRCGPPIDWDCCADCCGPPPPPTPPPPPIIWSGDSVSVV